MNKYFVETEKYEMGKKIFENFDIVVWTGRSGSGKSLASVHLLLDERYCNSPVIRVRTVKELKDIRKDKNSGNTILFIDDIFNSITTDDDLEDLFSEMKKKFNNYKCIITSEPRELKRACERMGIVSPLLNENRRVNIDSPNKDERKKIMDQHAKFASIENTDGIPSLLEEIEGTERFPILSILYFCNENLRENGTAFFRNPKKYLLSQIKEEIKQDETGKIKTLLFCLFFHEWSIREKKSKDTPLHIQSKDECENVLEKVPKEFREKFVPFTFEGLEDIAEPFVNKNLIHKCKQNGYQFFHNIVYEVVGSWIFDPEQSHDKALKFFPFEVIEHKVEIPTESEHLTDALCTVLHEQNKYKLSRLDNFQDICQKMNYKEEKMHDILNNPQKNSILMYSTGYHKLHSLAEKIYKISVDKDFDPDYQILSSLFGECASSSKGLTTNRTGWNQRDTDEIKKEVSKFKDSNDNNILHLVVLSNRSDKFAAAAVKRILSSELVNAKNKKRMTPLMLAVVKKDRKEVVKLLMTVSQKLSHIDTKKSNVFHLCVKSSIDDETCAEYLKLILSSKGNKRMINGLDGDKNTPLMLAAKQTEYSRICSISTLLEHTNIKRIADDKEEYPYEMVECLKSDAEYVQKELCIRKIIFHEYGHYSPRNKNIPKEGELEKTLKAFKITETETVNVPDSFLTKLTNETRRRILQCVQELKNVRLDRAFK